MNEYIFYTVEGYTEPPREDKSVENCQLLGTAFGENIERARNQLEKENTWIKDCGYDIDISFWRQLLSEENRKDIRSIVQYLIENKFCRIEDDDDVYNAVMRLKNIVD